MSLINKHSLGLSSSPTWLAATSEDPALLHFQHLAPEAPAFSTIYAFGDSLSDAGNDYISSFHLLPSSPPYSHGRFSNGNVWVQDLAQQLGLKMPKASLNGGTDYAYGGAEAGQEPLHTALPIDLPAQLLEFEGAHIHPAANALYTLSIGANDLLDAIPVYASNPTLADQDVQAAVANETQFVQGLIDWGAKTFDILNVPDLGKTPEEASAGTTATATSLSAQYDAAIAASLSQLATQDHVTIHLVDTFTLIDQGVADPGAFGLSNVTTPVWTGNYYDPFSGHLNAHGAAQNQYLFFDQLHPTAAGHSIIASAALTSLTAHA
jgi:phospholipase/lecithinase/hemolysin